MILPLLPLLLITTTYVTIDTRYATAGNIDGKTVTFTGNSNVSEVLWFDLNYKLPETDAQETVLKFENAYVYMTYGAMHGMTAQMTRLV